MSFRDDEKQRLIEKFETSTVIENGVVRWKSNSQVPPDDVLEVWTDAGLVFDREASVRQREVDMLEFLGQYRKNQANRSPEQIAEEQFELRVTFGPGVKVVNVITGEAHETEEDGYRPGLA
jgi:hypothetical protein